MAQNKTLELSIKIAGKVDKSLLSALNSAQSQVSSISTAFSRVGTVGLAAMGALATGTVAAIVKCTDAAEKFEAQMGDVVKYVDGLADAEGKISDKVWGYRENQNGVPYAVTYADNYALMSDALLDLSTQIPMTAEELTQLAAAAGQSGKGIADLIERDSQGNIAGFLKDVAMMGTAMDISAGQAGDWAAKWEVAFGMTHDGVMELSDQINYLGANNATTAAEIAQVVNDAASLGQVAGVATDTTAAMATAMLAMGVESGKTATSISRMYTNLSLGSSATKAQKEMWKSLGFTAEGVARSMQTDSTGTLVSVFEAINNLDADKQVAALKTLFGQWAIQGAAKLTGNLESFTSALDMVSDPNLYTGSMEREFIIKASTTESIDKMMANAREALKIDLGTEFLPVKKEFSLMLIDIMNGLRANAPELKQLAQTLATLLSQGVAAAGDALQKALPYIQQALDYLANNGPQVISVLGKLAAAFAVMKFAPGIEGAVRGAGGLLFGSGAAGAGASAAGGGLLGGVKGLFTGGQHAAAAAATAIPNLFGAAGSILGTARIDAQLSGRSLLGTLFSGAGTLLGQTGLGGGLANYFGGIRGSFGNLLNTGIGGGIANALGATGGALGEILSGISQATGLTDLVNGARGLAGRGGSWVAGKAGGLTQGAMGLAGRVVSSAPAQAVGGVLGNVGNFLGAGAGMLGSMWGPMASGFGSLFAGALPIVGVISGIIAVVSILGDHLEDIRGIVGSVFGDAGLAVFDSFIGTLQNVGGFITGLFADGGVAAAMAPLRDAITGMFGDDAGVAFDGLVQVLQSVMGVVGQVVTFANTTVKPIIEQIFGFITQTVVPILLQTFTAAAPAISGIISGLGTAIMAGMQIIGTAIQLVLPIIEWLITAFLSIASVVIPAVLAGWEVFAAGISTVISGVQTIFGGLIDFITGVFTGNWSLAWQGVQDIFKGIFEALGGLVKTPINAVISLINKAISGINGLGLDIPDWVPLIGGKKFSVNIPEIPMLARGGFTNGPSIAGEAGREAVISFQSGARASNIATWAKAGQMLGVGNRLADTGNPPVKLKDIDPPDGNWPRGPGGGGGGITVVYAPTLNIQGNADEDDLAAVLRDDKERFRAWFEAWYEEKRRNERRVRW